MERQDITDFTVNTQCCLTCPFAEVNGRQRNPELAADVITRNGLHGSQICHHANLQGKESTNLCRGHRDLLVQLLHRMGFLDEATNECFENTSQQVLGKI